MNWRKSSACASGECVEISAGPGVVRARDPALPGSPVLEFPASAWPAFTAAVKQAGKPRPPACPRTRDIPPLAS